MFTYLPYDAALSGYEEQAGVLLEAHRQGTAEALNFFHRNHPRFLDSNIPWLPGNVTADDIRNTPLGPGDARTAIARWYDFQDWDALAEYVEAVHHDAAVGLYESAVETVIDGNTGQLKALLAADSQLVHARSSRRTHFDPPVHRATLLHYVAANGVEGHRQRTPANAVEIAKMLLEAGAEVDALADLYGVPCTTMTLLVSSSHPAKAGLQAELAEALLDFGAAIEGHGSNKWGTPLMTALIFGYPATAEALARRGARVANIGAAAGLGRVTETERMLKTADEADRHKAFALASQLGRTAIVLLLLDAGEDPNRYNPQGFHAHATPLHQAVCAGHRDVVELLVERHAKLDLRDKIYRGTPLEWAVHCGKPEIEQFLRSAGAE